MADYTLAEGFPELPLIAGMVLKLEAINPTTGATVAGVTASKWAIYGDETGGGTLVDVVPLYTAEEIGEPA